MSTVVVVVFLIVVLFYTMCKSLKKGSTIIINMILGGALFLMLNILGMNLAVNVINIGLVAVLGIPGVVLIIILKFLGV